MEETRNAYTILIVKSEQRHSMMKDLEVSERIILKCIFKRNMKVWTGLIWLRIWSSGGLL
jgi:hypothetical protein